MTADTATGAKTRRRRGHDVLDRHRARIASRRSGSCAPRACTEIAKVRVDLEPARRVEMMAKTGRRTVPQIYIGDTHVGGFDDLVALDRAGKLEPLLGGG